MYELRLQYDKTVPYNNAKVIYWQESREQIWPRNTGHGAGTHPG